MAWPKPELGQQFDLGLRLGLDDEVFAGDAEMRGARGEILDDFRCGQEGDLDIVDAGEHAAIVARAARLLHDEAGAGEKGVGVFLQAAL